MATYKPAFVRYVGFSPNLWTILGADTDMYDGVPSTFSTAILSTSDGTLLINAPLRVTTRGTLPAPYFVNVPNDNVEVTAKMRVQLITGGQAADRRGTLTFSAFSGTENVALAANAGGVSSVSIVWNGVTGDINKTVDLAIGPFFRSAFATNAGVTALCLPLNPTVPGTVSVTLHTFEIWLDDFVEGADIFASLL